MLFRSQWITADLQELLHDFTAKDRWFVGFKAPLFSFLLQKKCFIQVQTDKPFGQSATYFRRGKRVTGFSFHSSDFSVRRQFMAGIVTSYRKKFIEFEETMTTTGENSTDQRCDWLNEKKYSCCTCS